MHDLLKSARRNHANGDRSCFSCGSAWHDRGRVVSRPAGPQGTAAHPLVTKAEYERWQTDLSERLQMSLQRIRATGHYNKLRFGSAKSSMKTR